MEWQTILPAMHRENREAAAALADEMMALQQQLEAKLSDLRNLETEDEGIKLMGRRYGVDLDLSEETAEVDQQPDPFLTLPRTDAVHTILVEADGEPLGPNEIQERLHARGRTDPYSPITAALARLKDSHRAHARGRGMWVAGRDPFEMNDDDDDLILDDDLTVEDRKADLVALRDELAQEVRAGGGPGPLDLDLELDTEVG